MGQMCVTGAGFAGCRASRKAMKSFEFPFYPQQELEVDGEQVLVGTEIERFVDVKKRRHWKLVDI